MIVTVDFKDKYVKTYSDEGKFIRQLETGRVFCSAVDIIGKNYSYEETEDYIDIPNSIAQKAKAYDILMGVTE